MSYSKTTWASGDVVTAAKLNNLEDGVSEALAGGGGGTGGGDVFVVPVTATMDGGTIAFVTDVSLADVKAALTAGKLVIYRFDAGDGVGMSVFLANAEAYIAIYYYYESEIDVIYHTADGIQLSPPEEG